MTKYFVRAVFDINCRWEGMPPVYRIYLNDELFTEREWNLPSDQYLEQVLQINAATGKYNLRLDPVGPCLADFSISNNRIDHGPARWVKNHKLVIMPWVDNPEPDQGILVNNLT